MKLTRDEIWSYVHAERRALATVLADLSDDEWATDSLCAGWTVKDVAGHVIAHPQTRLRDFRDAVPLLIRAHGSYSKTIYAQGKLVSDRPTAEIVADFDRLDGSRGHPPGTPVRFALIEILLHTQDIALPLGRAHAMPPVAAACAAGLVRPLASSMGVRHKVSGVRMVATDVEWSAGKGALVQGPMQQLLLAMAGRPADRTQLDGAGVAVLPGP
ncbi:maleylpyruvate isomerase family mycothiol-dependent enzyme [Rhodococcus tukisamuensis]|uniref:TIGR03083 family protein n=1 Tax=Rhodococcus tukisamuensis TaxID=168276 RepID=A0A1G6ZK71_9NOCA|nr:maleylpyruvate isomerase family mycothiol-dependent enzyme [Rhodococcus tukisamuensis]SDE03018.1 TIGR03083 family protein [Rhodococcus tukisamuensis]